jgi:hypothetical protein
MIRNDLQHIQLDSQKRNLRCKNKMQLQTFTAEGIEKKILKIEHLDFGLRKFKRPYTTMYVRRPGQFANFNSRK